jgi:hypothetical protein
MDFCPFYAELRERSEGLIGLDDYTKRRCEKEINHD